MAQYDVYRLRDGEIVLDVQTDLLAQFESRIVVPLMSPDLAPISHDRLNPQMVIDGVAYVMVPQFMAAIRKSELQKPMASLTYRFEAIKAALDMIFLGF
ncbi:MAG: CcdB family protein [Devosia sp.]